MLELGTAARVKVAVINNDSNILIFNMIPVLWFYVLKRFIEYNLCTKFLYSENKVAFTDIQNPIFLFQLERKPDQKLSRNQGVRRD